VKTWALVIVGILTLATVSPAAGAGQAAPGVERLLQSGYDLIESGKLEQAQKAYEELLRQDPGNPLALNNLAAIMVKQGHYDRALKYLKQALPRAGGQRVSLDRPCDVAGLCVAYRTTESAFGSQDLTEMIKVNIIAVELAAAAAPKQPEKKK
jgi:tetratricopeptide (TPR) repeat protein